MKLAQKLSCKEAARLMSMRRDRKLETDEETHLKDHLSICLNCRNFDQQIDILSELAKRFAAGIDQKSLADTHLSESNHKDPC